MDWLRHVHTLLTLSAKIRPVQRHAGIPIAASQIKKPEVNQRASKVPRDPRGSSLRAVWQDMCTITPWIGISWDIISIIHHKGSHCGMDDHTPFIQIHPTFDARMSRHDPTHRVSKLRAAWDLWPLLQQEKIRKVWRDGGGNRLITPKIKYYQYKRTNI